MIAGAQAKEHDYTYLNPTFETGIRLDGGMEVNLVPKKLKMNLNEEIRMDENFGRIQKTYSTLGIDYRILPWLRAGAAYSFIMDNSHSNGWGIRHRGSLYLTERVELGRWELSFQERIQATHRSDDVNLFESPKNEICLKTRVRLEYDIRGKSLKPYISAQTRFLLNGVRPDRFIYSASTGRWSNPDPEYSDVYFNRLRLNLGTKYRTSKRNEFNFFIVADMCYDLDIDLNSNGNQKKDESSPSGYDAYLYVKDTYFLGVGISYTFSIN